MSSLLMQLISTIKKKSASLINVKARWMSLLFILTTVGMLSSEAYYSYQAELRKAGENADNISLLLGDRLSSDIKAVDTLLVNVADAVAANAGVPFSAHGAVNSKMENFIQRQLTQTPVADNLALVSPKGRIVYTRVGTIGVQIDALPFFNSLRNNPDAKSSFSDVYLSPTTKLPVVSLAHSLKDSDQLFGGLVVADLDNYYFQRLLQNVNIGSHGSLTLLHENGRLVSRIPEVSGLVGQNYPQPSSVGPRLEHGMGWTAVGKFPDDEELRMFSVRKLPGVPFQLVVGLSDRDFLATWRTKIGIHSLFILCLLGLTLALERLMSRERRRTLELKESQYKLEQSRQQLQAVIEVAPVALAITRPEGGRIILSNQAMGEMVGQTEQKIKGRSLYEFCADQVAMEELPRELEANGYITHREVRILRDDGEQRWLLINASLIEFEDMPAVIIGGSDITERKKLEGQLMERATADPLTALANRRAFMEQSDIEFQHARRKHHPLSMLMIDIDRFKQINDGYGHAAGDRMIQTVAELLQHTIRAMDLAGRLGGDEFAVILRETTFDEAKVLANRICCLVSQATIQLNGGLHLNVTVSIGVATLFTTDDGIGPVLQRADDALYVAKRQGRNQAAGAADIALMFGAGRADTASGATTSTASEAGDVH